MESGVESTVCVLVVVIVVKWVFSLLETSRVSQLGQQFISQQGGGGGGGGWQTVSGGLLSSNTSLVTHLSHHSSQQKCITILCAVSSLKNCGACVAYFIATDILHTQKDRDKSKETHE